MASLVWDSNEDSELNNDRCSFGCVDVVDVDDVDVVGWLESVGLPLILRLVDIVLTSEFKSIACIPTLCK